MNVKSVRVQSTCVRGLGSCATDVLAVLREIAGVTFQELQKRTGYDQRSINRALAELSESGVITIN